MFVQFGCYHCSGRLGWYGFTCTPQAEQDSVNIFLIPYTWYRHLAMGFWCAAWGLMIWAAVLTAFVKVESLWGRSMDGIILMSALSGGIAFASIAGEALLRRRSVFSGAWRLVLAVGTTVAVCMAGYWFFTGVVNRVLFSDQAALDSLNPSLVSLRYRVGVFASAGFASGVGPLIVRRFRGWFSHCVGGLVAGLAGGIAWHLLNYQGAGSDLFYAGAALGLVWGFVHGVLCWGLPDELYAGWLRVMSWNRHTRRIPIDALDGAPSERFVGHFTRGLDLYLPADDEVMEMHVSVAVDAQQRYSARGLSLQPTRVRRFLERINLSYDAQRPTPLQTRLSSGDRIELGDSGTELEFIMLPKEER